MLAWLCIAAQNIQRVWQTFYGKWGEGFIEVHHLQALAENEGQEVQINPELDLTVLCANCHRMVHRKKGLTLTIEELKEKIRKAVYSPPKFNPLHPD